MFNNLSLPLVKEQVETPSLLIDLEKFEHNIDLMAKYFATKTSKLRPHTKTHKCSVIAKKQMDAGSIVGITVAKLGEAEAMFNGGIKDILISSQVVEPTKIARLARLSKHATITLAVDNIENIKLLDQAANFFHSKINVLIEVDVGLKRCGVDWGQPAMDLFYKISQHKNIVFRGLMGYEGHAVLVPEISVRKKIANESMDKLIETRRLFEKNGIPVEIVSGGGTGTYNITGEMNGVDEIQAGSYIFMDLKYQETSVPFHQSLSLYSTIISKKSSEDFILDTGLKAITYDFGLPAVKNNPDWIIKNLNEEHGYLHIPGGSRDLKIGDKIELIPSHGCTTVNLHERYYAIRQNRIESIWKIEGRGRFD